MVWALRPGGENGPIEAKGRLAIEELSRHPKI